MAKKIKTAAKKTLNNLKITLPVLLIVLLLISFVLTVLPKSFFLKIFSGNLYLDSFLGAVFGSIAAGSPITSYVIGGELLDKVSLVAIITFLLTWVTVGIVQLPAEVAMLGKRFAYVRNILSFISAIIISWLMVFTLNIF